MPLSLLRRDDRLIYLVVEHLKAHKELQQLYNRIFLDILSGLVPRPCGLRPYTSQKWLSDPRNPPSPSLWCFSRPNLIGYILSNIHRDNSKFHPLSMYRR